MTRIFVSYSSKNRDFAHRLTDALESAGYDVWFDRDDIRAGVSWDEEVFEGLKTSDILLLVVTPDSVASPNVKDEWSYFHSHDKPILPLRLERADVHFQLNRLQYIDFLEQDFDVAFDKLLLELKHMGFGLGAVQAQQQQQRQSVEVNVNNTASDNNLLPILAIVGVVAVVAIVGLLLFNDGGGGPPATAAPGGSTEQAALSTDDPAEAATDAPADAPTDDPAEAATDAPVDAPTDDPAEAATDTTAPVTSCPNSPEPRLTVGETAQTAPGFGFVSLRENPEGERVLQIPAGDLFIVLDGPICGPTTERSWYQASYDGRTGWVAEGDENGYWLQPTEGGPADFPIAESCPNSPEPRLTVGETAETADGFDFVSLREAPESERIEQIAAGEPFEVLAGPTCGETFGQAWYQVDYDGETGWVAEGDDDVYWAQPAEDTGTDILDGLFVGAEVVVQVGRGNAANLRVQATTESAVLRVLPNGTALEIVGGPEEAEDSTWWRVETANGVRGWVTEAVDGEIVIGPVE